MNRWNKLWHLRYFTIHLTVPIIIKTFYEIENTKTVVLPPRSQQNPITDFKLYKLFTFTYFKERLWIYWGVIFKATRDIHLRRTLMQGKLFYTGTCFSFAYFDRDLKENSPIEYILVFQNKKLYILHDFYIWFQYEESTYMVGFPPPKMVFHSTWNTLSWNYCFNFDCYNLLKNQRLIRKGK